MQTIVFDVDKQVLSMHEDNPDNLIEGTIGYIEAKFNFLSDDWDGTKKEVVFNNPAVGSFGVALDGDTCIIPKEVTAKTGIVSVAVQGTKDEAFKITTSVCSFYIGKTLELGDEGSIPPDLFQQIAEMIDKKADTITFEDGVLKLQSGDVVLSTAEIKTEE